MTSLFRSDTPLGRVLSRSTHQNYSSESSTTQQRRRSSSSTTSLTSAQASAWSAVWFYEPLPPPPPPSKTPSTTKSSSPTASDSMQFDQHRSVSPTYTQPPHEEDAQHLRWDCSSTLPRGHDGLARRGPGQPVHDRDQDPTATITMDDEDHPSLAGGKTTFYAAGQRDESRQGNGARATGGDSGQPKRIVWDQSTDSHPKRPRRHSHQRQQKQRSQTVHDQQQQQCPKDTYTLSDRTSIVLETRGDIPPRLIGASTTVFARKMYVFGGLPEGSSRPLNHLYILNLDTLIWTKHIPHDDNHNHNHHQHQHQHQHQQRHDGGQWPRERYFHSAIVVPSPPLVRSNGEFHGYGSEEDAHLIIFGGRNDVGCLNDTHLLDLNTLAWIPDTGLDPCSDFPSTLNSRTNTGSTLLSPEFQPAPANTTLSTGVGAEAGQDVSTALQPKRLHHPTFSSSSESVDSTTSACGHKATYGSHPSSSSSSLSLDAIDSSVEPSRDSSHTSKSSIPAATRAQPFSQEEASENTNITTSQESLGASQPSPQSHHNPFRFHRPSPRCSHLVSLSGDFMVVFGGRDAQGQHVQEISVLDLQRRMWVLGGQFHHPCSDDRSMLVHVDETILTRRRRRYREAFERDAVLRRMSTQLLAPSPSSAFSPSLGSPSERPSLSSRSPSISSRRPSNVSDTGEALALPAGSERRLSQPLPVPPHHPMQLGTASSADASKMIPLLNPLKDSGYRGEGEPFAYGNLGATLLANVQPAPPPRPPSKYSPLLDRMDLSGGRRRAMSESTDGTRAQQQRPSLAICPPGLDIPEAAISPTTTIDSMSLWSPSTTATTLHDTPMTRKNSATSGIQSATTTGSPTQHLQPGSQSFAPGVEQKVLVEESSVNNAKSDRSISGSSRQSLQRADVSSSSGSSIRSGSSGTNPPSGSKTSTGAMSSLFMNKYADVTTSAAFELDDLATAYARQRKRAATMGHTTQQQQQHQKQRQLSDKPLTPGTPTHSTGITSARNPAQSTHISSGGLTPSSSGQRVLSASNSGQPSLLARMVAENRKSRELSDQTLRDAMESQTKGQQQQSSSSNATSLLPPGAVTPTAVGSTSPGGTVAQSLSSMATTTSTPTGTTLESNTTKPSLPASSQTPIVKPTKPTLYLYTNSHDAINSQQPQSKQKSKNPKDRTRVTEEANKVYREFIKIQPATHSRAATGLLLAGKIMFDIDNEWAGLDEVVAGSDEHGLPPRLYYPTGHVVDRFMLISGLVYPNEAAETTTTTKGDSALEAAHQNPNQDQQQDPKVQEGTALAESFAIWRHNLETHEWTRLELTKSLSNGRWHRSVLDSKANMLYVLGKKNAPTPPSQPPPSSTSSSIESVPHESSDARSNNTASASGSMDAAVGASDVSPIRTTAGDDKTSSGLDRDRAATATSPSSASPSTSMALCFEHLVEVDLEGLDMPRGLEVNAIGPLGIQMGLEMLREGVGSDCVLVSAIDGGRVRVNSAIVGQRWGRFQRLMKDYERTRDLKARERLNENGEGEKGKEEGVAGSSGKVPEARKDKESDEKQEEGVALTNVDQEDDTSASQKASTATEKRTDAHADSSEKSSEGDQDRQATTNLAARERQRYLSDEPPEWQVPETTPILVAFLQYCYTNTLSTPHQLKLKTLQGLLLFAHTHDLTRLRQLCLWALAKHHLTAANAPQICETATLTGAFGLQTRALRVLLQTARLAELRRQSEANEYRRRLEFAITHMQAIEEDRRRLAIQQAQREAWKQGFTLGPAELLAAAQSATVGSGATDRIGSLMKGLGNSSGNSMGTKRSPLSSPTNLSTVERAGAATTHTSFVSRLFKSSRDEGLDTAMAGAALATTAAGVGSGSVSPDSSLQQNSGHRRTLSIGAALHPRGHHSHDSQQQSSQQVSPQLSPQSQPQPTPQHVLFVQGPAAPAKTLGPQPVDLSIRPEDAEKWMTLVSKIQQGEPLPRLSALGLIEGDSDLATRIEGSGDSGASHAGTGSDTVHGSDGLRSRPSMKRSTESMLLADAETEVVDSDDQPTEDGCDDEENEEEEEESEGEENEAEDNALGELQVQQQQQQLLSGADQGATTTTPSNDMISTIKSQRMRVASHDDSKGRTQEEASAFPSASSSSSTKSHLRSKSLHHLASVVTAAMTGSSRRPLASSSPSTGAEGNVSSIYSAKDKEKDKKKKLKKAKKNKSDLQLPTTVEEEGTPTSGSGSQSSSSSNVSTLSLASSARNCPEPRGSLSTSSREMSAQQQQQQAGLPLHRTESFGSIENRELPSFLSLSSSSFFNTSGRHAPTTAATSAAMPPPPPLSQQSSNQRSTRHSFHLNLSNAFPFLNNSASSSSSSLVSASSMASPAAGTPIGGSGTGQSGGSTNNSGNSSNKPSLSWLSFRSSSVPNTPSAGMVEPLASATTTAAGSTMQAMNHKLLQQQLQQQLQEQQLSPWQLPPPRFDDEPMDYFRYSHYTTTIPETEEDSGSSSGSGGGHVEVIVSTPTPTASRYPTSGTASSGSMTKPMLTPPSAAGLHAGAPRSPRLSPRLSPRISPRLSPRLSPRQAPRTSN